MLIRALYSNPHGGPRPVYGTDVRRYASGMVPLSVLDLSPVTSGSSGTQALRNSLDLAELADRLGHTRPSLSHQHHLPPQATPPPPPPIPQIPPQTPCP